MLRQKPSHKADGVRQTQPYPRLFAQLRLFGLLAVLGPLFAGLNFLVLESVPRVEIRFIAAESPPPASDVVLVERVVERVVYVPVDNLAVTGPLEAPSAPAEPSGERADEATASGTPDASEPEAVAAEPQVESLQRIPAAARWVPVIPVRVQADEEATDEEEVASEPEAAPVEVAEEPANEPVAEATPRVIVVHTMVWDGEQFVESNDGPPTLIEVYDDVADASSEPTAEVEDQPEQVAEGADQPEQIAEGAAVDDAPEQVADGAVVEDQPEQVAESADESMQLSKADDDVEQAAEADAAPEQVADSTDEPEHVADAPGEGEPVADASALTTDIADDAAEAADVAEAGEHAAGSTEESAKVIAGDGEPEQSAAEADPESARSADVFEESPPLAETDSEPEQVVDMAGDAGPPADTADDAAQEPVEGSDEPVAESDEPLPDDEPAPRARHTVVETVYVPISAD